VTTADDRDDGEAVSDVTRYFATDGIERATVALETPVGT
jgi:hypothetical protein